MWWVRVILVVLPFTLLLQQGSSSSGEEEHVCFPSSCGKITNISYPFRLKDDPQRCGDSRYELSCENNKTVLSLYSGKYHVQAINYKNFTIRLVDPGVQEDNCSSIPRYFLSRSNFCDTYDYYSNSNCTDPYHASAAGRYSDLNNSSDHELLFQHIVYLNCTHPVTENPKYVDTASCVNWQSKGYIYAIAGDLIAEDFLVDCQVKLVAPTSWWGLGLNESYRVMHRALFYGFEISWMHRSCHCQDYCRHSTPRSCFFNTSSEKLECSISMCHSFLGSFRSGKDTNQNQNGKKPKLRLYATGIIFAIFVGLLKIINRLLGVINLPIPFSEDSPVPIDILQVGWFTRDVLLLFWAARFLFGMTLFIALLINKWRKSHLSTYQSIETYLQQNNLTPIAYSYKEIKKMARGFKDKLGEGGFGTVFKGYLRSGPCAAIKVLGKSKGNGQDFLSEVATIGRIHHLNVVQLIGFCVEGSKRALVYEFMPNGSLDKFIFSKEGSINLSYDKIYDISLGVARGIAYLHHGCEMKILHFDIKPHNILLDENFTPKVSDFGLAKLCPVDNSIVTMTAARGTIGYMAPELFYKNIGGVSYKADVYSFGMLLMEMSSKRRNLNPHAEHSSQLYFPLWIYDQIGKEEDAEIEEGTEEEKKIVKKMVIVALWCIQLKPDDRPSMSKVVEMLEGDVESLDMPPKPTLYPHETIAGDHTINSGQTMSSDFISSNDSAEIETDPL